eukprot:TRINITY_DN5898_c0_g1_i1.p1 TRINITY_DN5898_c0_g1~~TRINITY_DN5898_c0_g1_i1.p1  ORF type:complete len:547 (+),score=202.63 TRINITY_DN5898_c0_g1_i1:64-1704(+)
MRQRMTTERQSRLDRFKGAVKGKAKGMVGLARSFSADDLAGRPRGVSAREKRRQRYYTTEGTASLLRAAERGSVHDVQRLLDAGEADPSAGDARGRTALHFASARGDLGMVRLLSRQEGIDVNAADADLRTAYTEAVGYGHEEVAEFLSTHGAVTDEKYLRRHGAEHQRGRSRSASAARDKSIGRTSMETGDVVDHNFIKKVVVLGTLPFVVLLLMLQSWHLFLFLLGTTAWLVVVLAFLVTEMSITPPWYHPTPGKKELAATGLPAYWMGIYTNPKYDLDLDYDDVDIVSGAYTLRAWWIPRTKAKTGIVFVHGGGRDRRAWLRHVEMFSREGFSCLLFDFREHGSSDGTGKGFSYGVGEMHDVRAAAKWLRQQKGIEHVVVIGTSVGGSAAILATHGCKDIDVVIAENPITRATALQNHHTEVAIRTLMGTKAPARAFMWFFCRLAALILNLRLGVLEAHAVDVIDAVEQPLLLMHGTGDEVVPHSHSEELFAAAKEPKEMWLAPDGFHCGLYNRYPEDFRERTLGFIRRHMPASSPQAHGRHL